MANRTVVVRNKEDFVERIVEKGLSNRQLAKKAGISQTTICLIVNGERNPSPNTAVNICKVLECQFDDIFFIQNVDCCKQKTKERRSLNGTRGKN